MSSAFGDWYKDVQGGAAPTFGAQDASGGDDEGAPFLAGFGAAVGSWVDSIGVGGEKKTDDGPAAAAAPGFGGMGGVLPTFQTTESFMGLSYAQRFRIFVGSLLSAGLFFFLAFVIGLPVILIRPAKFAISFTVGSLLYMTAFAMLRGPQAHLNSLMAREMWPFSATYVGSMLLTLYASLIRRSYLVTVFASGLQLTALGYYLVAGIPGGTRGLQMCLSVARKMVYATAKVAYKCCSSLADS